MNIKKIVAVMLAVLMLSAVSLLVACGGDETASTGPELITFEEYLALSEAEQLEYFNSFPTPEEYFAWYNDARAEYDAEHNPQNPTPENPGESGGNENEGGSISGGITEGDKIPEEDNTDKEKEPEGEGTENENNPEGTEPGGDSTEGGENEGGNTEGEGTENENNPEDSELTYEEYIKLSEQEQTAYFNSFENPQDFFNWFQRAKAKYDEENKGQDVGEDGNIDLGGITQKP